MAKPAVLAAAMAAPGPARPSDVRSRTPMTDRADLSGLTDAALMPAIARGDARAFGELFRRQRGGIYRFALHMTGSAPAADDVTQDVFLAVMREAGRFDPGKGTVAAWLGGIARNLVRRRLERERVFDPLPADEGRTEGPLPIVADDPVDGLARAERLAALRRAVLSLPIRYREAVVLCDLQEASYAEAAAALDCAVGTVRSRLFRGRALLAAKLAALEGRPAQPPAGPRKRCMA